jgi:uncharacterized protein
VRLENSFEVDASPEAAWALLMDVPRVVPCMPGATLDEVVDDSNWKATMQVKLGPIGLTFATNVKREEVDEAARRATLAADAREVRNRGRAKATIQSTIVPLERGSRVELVTELALAGSVAQYGRGLLQDVSSRLVASFAQCLQSQLVASSEEAEAALAAQAKPVSGLSLILGAIGRAVSRIFRRKSPRDGEPGS